MDLDLRQFCDPDDSRVWLHAPFSHAAFTYATDGIIMVRVPLIEGAPAALTPKLGDHLVKLFDGIDRATFVAPEAVTIPDEAETSEDVECESCEGRGKDHECPDCTCTCDDCRGTGIQKNIEKISTEFYGNIYRLKYIRQMFALPRLEIAPDSVDEPKRIPLKFRFEGGCGLLMPRSSRCRSHVDLSKAEAA